MLSFVPSPSVATSDSGTFPIETTASIDAPIAIIRKMAVVDANRPRLVSPPTASPVP